MSQVLPPINHVLTSAAAALGGAFKQLAEAEDGAIYEVIEYHTAETWSYKNVAVGVIL